MNFTNIQLKQAYKKLSAEAQSFVMSNETTELIEKYLQDAKLSEEQENSADSEIWYALLGLQSLSEAIKNIAEANGKSVEDFGELERDLQYNIFDNIPEGGEPASEATDTSESISEPTISAITQTPAPIQSIKKDPVKIEPQSFEQIILNQARAMQPARPVKQDEVGRIMNHELRSMGEKKEPPSNLPIGNEQKPIHDYKQGEDPYREAPE